MHELSIALSIVEMAQEEALSRNVRVEAVYLKLGALSGVVKEALLFSYEIACEGTALQGSRLLIDELPVVIFCTQCQREEAIRSVQLFCCPQCGTPSGEVVQGRELEVVAIETLDLEGTDSENQECAPNPA